MDKQTLGKWGEDFTCRYLQQNGYEIIARNVHSRYGEIDIIAQKGSILAFVEVKTRTAGALYAPREAVTFAKRQKIVKTAQFFLLKHNFSRCQPRFDVMEIICNAKPAVFKHTYIENAFEAEGF